ncbi:MAG: type II toxin-antitoxin system RelE/ParE family toxin [Bryobacteraceae bacterium]
MRRVATPIRTATFSRRVKRLLTETETVKLEQSICQCPDAHPVIPGTGGIRKARWARSGMGKRGGVRAVYYFLARVDRVYMLDVYAKNEKADLTAADKRELRAIVSMLEEA